MQCNHRYSGASTFNSDLWADQFQSIYCKRLGERHGGRYYQEGKPIGHGLSGDAKTLLAFNLDKQSAKNLAGFTIQCQAGDKPAYYLFNQLQFKTPADHAQDAKEPPRSSINAPIHKFRWVHVLGTVHQGIKPFFGTYTYTVTPRYFDNSRLLPLDPSLRASLKIEVNEFTKGNLELGFTRGYTQSQPSSIISARPLRSSRSLRNSCTTPPRRPPQTRRASNTPTRTNTSGSA